MRRALALAASLLAVAGCGDDGDAAAEYREQATAICATATDAAAELQRPEDSAESVSEYAAAAAGIREREVVALDELEPPEDLEAEHRRFVNASGAVVRSLRDLAAAAARDDRAAAAAAAGQGARAAQQARESAAELDLPRCGLPGGVDLGG